jgi:hypothetical protein
MKLTENVDDALFVAEEMGRVGTRRGAGAGRASERG